MGKKIMLTSIISVSSFNLSYDYYSYFFYYNYFSVTTASTSTTTTTTTFIFSELKVFADLSNRSAMYKIANNIELHHYRRGKELYLWYYC
jgi:hypothetical protein